MDKKFLDKVIDQIVSETTIDNDQKEINFPFSPNPLYYLTTSHIISTSLYFVFPSFKKHLIEVYSLKGMNERKYVWEKYEQIIKNMIKSKGNLNESNGMDYNFLDKIVNQIVSETEIDYKSRRLHTPFTSPYTPHLLLPSLASLSKHCKDVYGLKDEQEIRYVWDKYKQVIKGKIKSKDNINESTIDNSFLDKVIDQLVSETIINREEGRLYTPFLPLLLLHSPLFSVSLSGPSGFSLPLPPFSDHCKDIYGIKDEQEIKYVWKEYMKIIKGKIKSKENINESTIDNSFLDKVVNQIVSETTIDYDKEEMDVPFSPFSPHLRHYPNLSHFPFAFEIHCRDVYGIKDKEEVDYIWAKYGEIIKDKFYPKDTINESTIDNKFLDKVVNQIVSETMIDDYTYYMYTPFTIVPFLSISSSQSLPSSFNPFIKHCKDVYGLNEQEIEYVWKRYREIVLDMIKSKENINESKDIDNRFLDKVVDQLVSETTIDNIKKEVKLHFTTSFTYLHLIDSNIFPYPPFEEHLEDVYSLKEMSERKYVQDKYELIINNMLNPKDNINESHIGQDRKFLDKVVKQLVDETKIESSESYTPFRELPFRIPISFTFVPELFMKHCIDIYSIGKWEELRYVWDTYKEIINNKS